MKINNLINKNELVINAILRSHNINYNNELGR